MKQRHEPRPPMDLDNMYEQGVHHLIAYCRNDACRHQTMRAAHQPERDRVGYRLILILI